MRSGARLTAGFWFTPQEDRGIEASWFGLAITKKSFNLSTTGGNPYLARPYIDANTGQPAAVVIPEPGLQPGPTGQPTPTLLDQTADAALRSQFGSVDVLYRYNTTKGEDFHRRYWAGGFRYLMLEDQLAVNLSSSVSTGATSFDTYTASDSFRTLNQFYGGEFGMIEKWWRDRWSLQVLGKVALGATTVSTRINGIPQKQQQPVLAQRQRVLFREASSHSQPTLGTNGLYLPLPANSESLLTMPSGLSFDSRSAIH
jgi:hypothetical protein